LAVALVAGIAAVVLSSRPTPTPPTVAASPAVAGETRLADRPAPDEAFPLPDRTLDAFGDGAPVDLTAFRGTPLVVNFWATWCAPCVKEMPDFQQVASDVGDDVAFLGVNVQDSPAVAEPFATELGVDYALAADPQGEFYKQVRSFGMPTTLFVDADGAVVFRHTGALDAEQLRDLLERRLGVPAA
ncbi:MAG: TlpA family protein disulfide reductase, partial [Actinomycetota bacterium]|nr:TlpA family protein disulfide reductase [Actinomycetota bacterium]